jgi:hypothetical protein
MTVTAEGRDAKGKPRTSCTWFNKDDVEQNGVFPPEALESTSAPVERGPSGLPLRRPPSGRV